MRKLAVLIGLTAIAVGAARAQITVTSPGAGRDEVKASADYADDVLHDRWDMNERTDLGWCIFNTVDQPASNLGSISFTDGIFSAVSTSDDPNIFILDSAYKLSAMNGKNGYNFPINADKYKIFAIRMRTDQSLQSLVAYLYWSKDTIYDGVTTAGPFDVRNGWAVHIIRIPDLVRRDGVNPWAGTIGSLRLDPFYEKGKNVQIDWIRLVEEDPAGLRTITWIGGGGNIDIYLDDDADDANGNLGALARNVSGTSYEFRAGALAPGEYRVAIVPTGATSGYVYAPGYYHVNDNPILDFSKPSAEGSTDDFISTYASDPWDMENADDVEHTEHLVNPQFTTITYEDFKGTTFANQKVYVAGADKASPPNVGDPTVFLLHFLHRGATTQIDASRYHNLTLKMGIWGAQSVNDGSIARILWRNRTETTENVSQDVIVLHQPNKWIMSKIVLDLAKLPLEEGAGSPSHSGWTGFLDCFRVDPHEFSDGRQFFIDDVKITADWKADASFPIEWALSDSDGSPTVSLYYDTDASGYNGTLIASLSAQAPGAGSYTWITAGVPEGTYWIYAVTGDGTNTHRAYARGPVIVDHGQAQYSTIELSRTEVYMGATRRGAATGQEEVVLTNSGTGAFAWTAQSNKSWLTVTPTSGSGDAVLKIAIANGTMAAGKYTGQVTVTAPGATNSPRTINVHLTIYSSTGDASPFGSFDSPENNATVMGSIAVTGWTLDDIEVKRVEVRREPVSSDPSSAIGADGLIFLGNAYFIRGARPDVEADYAQYPRADHAGWGFMVLTYGLPNQGNGVFRIHAVAFDGTNHRTDLGVKQITSDNAHNTLPFGAIDTPGQGGKASGTEFVNFGWALTPMPKSIPTDGSTLQVFVDSIPLGRPAYNAFRQDIHDQFPDYNNSDGAVGYYILDTTKYENGLHTIQWTVQDDAGAESGIGSRFFEVMNISGASGTAGASGSDPASLGATEAAKFAPIDPSGRLKVAVAGKPRLKIQEMGSLRIDLKGSGGTAFIGWGEDPAHSLPIGSTLDPLSGVFRWIPAPGFLGRYALHFALTNGKYISRPIKVIVEIVPKKFA
jgi:hypothetical protein